MTEPVLAAVEAALVERFGHPPQRASVSFVGVEPIEVLRFEPTAGDRAYVTLGMSRHAMTGAAESIRSADGPRAELLLVVRDPADVHRDVWRRLAVLAAAPVVEGVVHVPGMSVELGEPLVLGSSCTGFVIAASAYPPVATPVGAVDLLSVLPATNTELAWCRVRGTAALTERWQAAGVDERDLLRRSVELG